MHVLKPFPIWDQLRELAINLVCRPLLLERSERSKAV